MKSQPEFLEVFVRQTRSEGSGSGLLFRREEHVLCYITLISRIPPTTSMGESSKTAVELRPTNYFFHDERFLYVSRLRLIASARKGVRYRLDF